jgi:hypothetical protein
MIGVIFEEEKVPAHYFSAELPRQFDAVVHFDLSCPLLPFFDTG